MTVCSHCGKCCLSGIPCYFGQILFDITENNPKPCPACEKIDTLYWCGLIKHPVKWFSKMVGDIQWKCEAMKDIAEIYIGISDGCGMNPTQDKIVKSMREYAQNRSK